MAIDFIVENLDVAEIVALCIVFSCGAWSERMYFIIRFIVASIFVIIGMRLFFKRKQALTLRRVFIAMVISYFTAVLLELVPFENSLFRFSSPQDAYAYQSPTKDYTSILQGNETAIFLKKDSEGELVLSSILTKDELGWKLAGAKAISSFENFNLLSSTVSSFCVKNPYSNELLLMIYIRGVFDINQKIFTNPYPNGLNISDTRNSEFYLMPADDELDWPTYYTFISDIDEAYKVYVNGIDISKELNLLRLFN